MEIDELSKLKIDELKELAVQHDIELSKGDKKDDIILKISESLPTESTQENIEVPSIMEHLETVEEVVLVDERLENNIKVTEDVRIATQEESNMSVEDKEKNAPVPSQTGQADASKAVSDIAEAIREATNGQKNFQIMVDDSVEPRFAVVKNAQGEVMIQEVQSGHLSKVQLESLEEKEASIQNQEVTKV